MITKLEDFQHLCSLFISFNIGKDWRELESKGNEKIMEAAPKIVLSNCLPSYCYHRKKKWR